ncbi:MAG: transketolase [Bacteroidaceae bacterium]|nr:transketolase [Bacteroidaceae bacterium]
MNDIKVLNHAADNIRILAASMVEKAKSGHPGGAMGGADFINVLYSEYLNYDPADPTWVGRDRFFLDPGHMAPMLYSQLALIGKFSLDELQQLRQWGSPTPGHPEADPARGIENTSGPLGQGHTFGIGAAIAAKFLAAHTGNPTFEKETIYIYISDGGVQEEISQGAARIAGTLGLDNVVMFYDSNDIQLSTETAEVMNEDTAAKYRALGWEVFCINGNDASQIRTAIEQAKAVKGKPALIIGKTIMGKGALKDDGSSYERNCKTHGAPLGGDAYRKTIANLGGDADNPFVIFDDVKELYARRAEELKGIVAERKAEEAAWAAQNPECAAAQTEWFSGKAPQVDWSKVQQKSGDATRNASAAVLSQLAQQVPNMIVASADLSNSDKTDGFLKQTHALKAGDFSGAFFQAGVAELTMACCCIGMALHGGVIPACGTFFVFSDYMKPAVRMAALMELPVKFIWTHDAFRVGEDGPTHEPVEQEAQIRLMEKLKNHHGKNSTLVLRPADAQETTAAWCLAMENTTSPTALILSRQNIADLPAGNDYSQAAKGAYIVAGSDEQPDVILLASGSEVSTLVAGAELLRRDGVKVRIVSVPSEGLFRSQPKEYQQCILPAGVKKFGLTAGLPVNLEGLVGADGSVWGLESFGFSAPYKVLDEKLGFTADNVYKQVKALLA